MVKRRCSPLDGPGITISERGCGFAEASMEPRVPALVLLSLLRSISVFSPLTAGLLVNPPDGLAEEAPDSGWGLATELPTPGVSTPCATGGSRDNVDCTTGPGMLSPSLQLAGVGGTGPRAAIPPGGGLRVGGDMIGSLPEGIRWTLWDLPADGGGPGGGGGTGMLGSHLTCEEERDRADVGVETAGVDAARRAPGAILCDASESFLCGIWSVSGPGWPATLRDSMLKDLVCGACSTGGLVCSSRLLLSDGSPKRLSREAPLVPGGGGKDVFATGAGGSVATRCIGGGGALATDTLATCV